jgi:hypothetical protein
MAAQSFTKNHRDHSNDTGFQFEFFCDKCGNGHRSAFKTNGLGVAANLLKAAGAMFGGRINQAGWGVDHVKDAFRGPAWDSAFASAIDECRPKFRQCSLCGNWVCPEVCWNPKRNLCEACAPDLGEHAARAQAEVAVEQAREQARNADQLRGVDVQNQVAVAALQCAKCQASLAAGAKFCASCGAPAGAAAVAGPRFCSGCGTALTPGARFCAGCGTGVPG